MRVFMNRNGIIYGLSARLYIVVKVTQIQIRGLHTTSVDKMVERLTYGEKL